MSLNPRSRDAIQLGSLITVRPDDVVFTFANPTVAGELPACNCAIQAPTYPVFRPTPHLPGCPSYRE